MQQSLLHKAATTTFLAILGLVPLRCDIVSAQVREWTDNTGKYKFRAELIRVENDVVVFRSEASGREKNVPLNRLSDAGQAWVNNFRAARYESAKVREWTDNTGKYKFLAELVRVENDVVVFRSEATGREKNVPINRLSDADQARVNYYLTAGAVPPKPEVAIPKETNSATTDPPTHPPGPRIVTREPEKPESDPLPTNETRLANAKTATVIPDIGEVDLKELANLPSPFSKFATLAASSNNLLEVRSALANLGELPPKSTNESVLNLLRKHSLADDRLSRMKALKVLAKVSPSTCLPFVLRAANDNNYEVKWQAFEQLKELNDASCIEPLATKFASSDRSQIASILENFGPQAELYMHKMVTHSKTEVRLDAVRLLGRIGTSASLDILNKALNDENVVVRLQAKTAIKSIKSRNGSPQTTDFPSPSDNEGH